MPTSSPEPYGRRPQPNRLGPPIEWIDDPEGTFKLPQRRAPRDEGQALVETGPLDLSEVQALDEVATPPAPTPVAPAARAFVVRLRACVVILAVILVILLGCYLLIGGVGI